MAAYGFVAGLPLPLSGFTFRLWLSEGGVSLGADRPDREYRPRLLAEVPLVAGARQRPAARPAAPPRPPPRLAGRDPAGARRRRRAAGAVRSRRACPFASLAAAALVAFLSASQDIVVDAWRIEVFAPHRQGAAMAAYVWGYRVALLIATTGVISAVSTVGWHVALLGVAALIGLRPGRHAAGAGTAGRRSVATGRPASRSRLAHAVIEPLRDFLTRRGALLILAFVALFKLGEAMAGIMTAPFYRALGFSREAIAATGWFSLGGTLAGIALGGWLVARLGIGRALLRTGWAQTIAMAMYLLLAVSAGEHHVLYATVTTEAFAQGMADAAFITYLSGLCSRAFTATHYALLSSLAAIAVHTIGGASGVLAAQVGWVAFYALCMFAALPSMGLMLVLLRRYPPDKDGPR